MDSNTPCRPSPYLAAPEHFLCHRLWYLVISVSVCFLLHAACFFEAFCCHFEGKCKCGASLGHSRLGRPDLASTARIDRLTHTHRPSTVIFAVQSPSVKNYVTNFIAFYHSVSPLSSFSLICMITCKLPLLCII